MDITKGLQHVVAVVAIVLAVIASSQARSIQQRSCEAPEPPTCDSGCNDISYYHSKQTGVCVECISCPPGQEPNVYDPCVEGKEAICQPCPEGYFSTENDQERCKPCGVCSERVATTECSATTDRACGGCKPGFYDDGYGDCYPCVYLSPIEQTKTKGCFATTTQTPISTTPTSKLCEVPQPPDCSNSCDDKKYYHSRQSDTCEECLSCPTGEEPTDYPGLNLQPCEAQARGEEVKCRPCKSGYFSDRHDQSRCKPCTLCDAVIARVTTTECSASTNRVCGGCKPDYYNSHGDCVPCSFLSEETQKTHATCSQTTTTPAIKATTTSQTTSQIKSTTTKQMRITTGKQMKTTPSSKINPVTKGSPSSASEERKLTATSTSEFHWTSKPKEIVSHPRHGARQDISEIIFRLALIGGGIAAFALIVYCMVYCMRNERKKLQYSTCSTGYTRTSTGSLPSGDRDDSDAESGNKPPVHQPNQGNSRSQEISTAPTRGTRQQDDPEIVANLSRANPPKTSFNKEVDVHQTRTEPQTCPHGGDAPAIGPLISSNGPSPLKSMENIPRRGRSISLPHITLNHLDEINDHPIFSRELPRISDASSGEESDNGTANFPEEETALLSHKATDLSLSQSLKVPPTRKLSRRRSSSGGLKSNGGVFSSGSTKDNFALDSAPTSMNNPQPQSQRSIQGLTSHPSRTRRKSLDLRRQSSFDNPLPIRDQSPNNEPNERDALIQGLDNTKKSPVAQPQQPGEGVPAYVSYQPVHEQYGEKTDEHGKQYARQQNVLPAPNRAPNPRMHQRPIPHSTASNDSIHVNSNSSNTLPNQSPAAAVHQIFYNGPVIQAANIHNLQLDLGNNNNLVQQGGAAACSRPRDVPPTPESVECTDSAVIFPIPEEEAKCAVGNKMEDIYGATRPTRSSPIETVIILEDLES